MRPRPNILFVNLPSIPLEEVAKMISGRSYYRQYIAMPMGLLYISGYMRESVKVADVSLIDFALLLVNAPSCDTIDEFIDTALSQVDHTPDVVGISLIFSAAYKFFTLLSAAIKRHWPDAKVVVGGNHATSASQTILEHNVDHVICGEGEIVFSEFLQGISIRHGTVCHGSWPGSYSICQIE